MNIKSIKSEYILLTPAIIYVIAFYFIPIAGIFLKSIAYPDFTLDNYVRIFRVPVYLKVFYNTLKISLSVSLLCLLLGFPIAYLMVKSSRKLSNFLLIIVTLPFWTSILVRSYAWLILLQREGLINKSLIKIGIIDEPINLVYNIIGVNLGMSYILLPYMILAIYTSMKNIDLNLCIVAKTLGAKSFTILSKIIIPLSLPGILSGFLIVFILSIGYFITPALLGGRTETMIAMLIETQMNDLLDWGFGSALSFFLFLSTILLLLIFSKLINLSNVFLIRKTGT